MENSFESLPEETKAAVRSIVSQIFGQQFSASDKNLSVLAVKTLDDLISGATQIAESCREFRLMQEVSETVGGTGAAVIADGQRHVISALIREAVRVPIPGNEVCVDINDIQISNASPQERITLLYALQTLSLDHGIFEPVMVGWTETGAVGAIDSLPEYWMRIATGEKFSLVMAPGFRLKAEIAAAARSFAQPPTS